MEAKEYRSIDKSGWARGEWDDEPDKMQFADEATGLPCLIVRGPMGSLCGYVGVPEGHPAFEKDYDEIRCIDSDGEPDYIEVHGGLTFADKCHQHKEGEHRGICHVPGEGEPDHVWWLGFDCAHSGDYLPAHSGRPESCFRQYPSESYRDVPYVQWQIRGLARQLASMHP